MTGNDSRSARKVAKGSQGPTSLSREGTEQTNDSTPDIPVLTEAPPSLHHLFENERIYCQFPLHTNRQGVLFFLDIRDF